MDPVNYHFLSAPLWIIEALHIITLTLHFIAMNFLVGGIVIILFGKFTNRWENPVVVKFVKLFPAAMAATISFGVAPLLFVQLVYGQQVYSASIVSGWFWLWIVPAAIVGYYFLYAASFTKSSGKPGRKGLFLSLALLMLVYISYIYSSVFSLAEQPDLYAKLYAKAQDGLILNPNVGSTVVRWLHMMLGAVTVGGFFVGLLGRDNERAYDVGKTFFKHGMIAASFLGFAYMMTFGDYIKPFMRSPGIWWLTVAVIVSFGSLHLFSKKKFLLSGGALFVGLLGMVVTRHEVRLLRLADTFTPDSLPVYPQWAPLIIFLVSFAVAVAVIWYMVKLFMREK